MRITLLAIAISMFGGVAVCSAAAAPTCKPNKQGDSSPTSQGDPSDPNRCQASSGGGQPQPMPMPMPSGGGNNDQPNQNQPPQTNDDRNNLSDQALLADPPDDAGTGRTIGGGGVLTNKRGAGDVGDPLSIDQPYNQAYNDNAVGTVNIQRPAMAHKATASEIASAAGAGGAAPTSAGGAAQTLSQPKPSFFGGMAPSKGGDSGVQDASWLSSPPGALNLSPSQQAMLQSGSDSN